MPRVGASIVLSASCSSSSEKKGCVAASVTTYSSTHLVSPYLVHRREGCLVQELRTNRSHDQTDHTP